MSGDAESEDVKTISSLSRIEALIEERKKIIQKTRNPPKEKPSEILVKESIKSMNGVVRLMTYKYGIPRILGQFLFCEPSREKRAYEVMAYENSEKRYLRTNHFPSMKILVRKVPLTNKLNPYKKLFSKLYSFYPNSWDLSKQSNVDKFKSQFDSNRTYIMKPSAGHQGDGIFLCQNWDDVVQCIKIKPRTIAQEYVVNPLLLEGYKFDFRVYVLVESVEPFRVYVFREGLARLCTKKYEPPTAENLNEDFMHLTNYSLNKFSKEFVDGVPFKKVTSTAQAPAPPKQGKKVRKSEKKKKEEEELVDEKASKRRLSVAIRQLCEAYKFRTASTATTPSFAKEFWASVDSIVAKTMITLWRVLWTRYNDHFPPQVLNSWHHPDCVNSPLFTSPTSDSVSTSSTSSPYQTVLLSASLSAQSSSQSEELTKQEGSDSETPSELTKSTSTISTTSTSTSSTSFTHSGLYRSSSTDELTSAKKEESDEETEDVDEESDETQKATHFNQKKKKCDCHKMSRCFHLIGFDLLMDSDLNLHLLEVNNNPSMLCRASHLDSTIKQGIFESCLRLMGVIQDHEVKMVRNKSTLQFFDLSLGRPTSSVAAPERTCEELRPGVTFGHILKQVEPGLANVIDRL